QPGLQEAQLFENDELRVAELGGAELPPALTGIGGFGQCIDQPLKAALEPGDLHELADGPLDELLLIAHACTPFLRVDTKVRVRHRRRTLTGAGMRSVWAGMLMRPGYGLSSLWPVFVHGL